MQNWRLDDLISAQSDNTKLTTGTLAAYDGFDFAELYRFRQIFYYSIDATITGSEEFPGEMLTPKNNRVSVPNAIYELLVK